MLAPVAHDPYANPRSLESRFRLRRFERVLGLIERTLAERGRCRIMDVGGTETYWNLVKPRIARPGVEVWLCNLTAPEVADTGLFVPVAGDACDMSEHADNSFDLVHSNSVIEHVGGWRDMRRMAENVRRLAPAYYVQTPYFWFPIEPHFRSVGFHWLPQQMRYRRVMRRANGFRDRQHSVDAAMQQVESCALLDKGQMRELFPDAVLNEERVLGVTKSLMAVRERREG